MIAGHYFIPEVSKTRFLCDLNVEKAKICNQAQDFNFAKTRYLQFVKKKILQLHMLHLAIQLTIKQFFCLEYQKVPLSLADQIGEILSFVYYSFKTIFVPVGKLVLPWKVVSGQQGREG